LPREFLLEPIVLETRLYFEDLAIPVLLAELLAEVCRVFGFREVPTEYSLALNKADYETSYLMRFPTSWTFGIKLLESTLLLALVFLAWARICFAFFCWELKAT
jgi:hypothetical protein